MGLLDFLRKKPAGLAIRCGMCRVVTAYPLERRGEFVFHSCDADLLIEEPDPAVADAALDLFATAVCRGPQSESERVAARDRLLYDLGEAPIPLLEDLLYRIKYELREPWPFPEIARRQRQQDDHPRIDFGNELEMFLHRMKKYAITRRQIAKVGPSARPILEAKLARLKTDPLVPLEED